MKMKSRQNFFYLAGFVLLQHIFIVGSLGRSLLSPMLHFILTFVFFGQFLKRN